MAARKKAALKIYDLGVELEEIEPFIASYQASVKKYPNLTGGQPNNQPPHYGAEDPAAETGAEGVHHKLASIRQH